MKSYILFLQISLILLFSLFAQAEQPPEEQWVARYNGPVNDYDRVMAMAMDDSGNIYVTGYSYGIGTHLDYATIKYDPNGDEQWVARYNGPANGADHGYDIGIDNWGNVYVTGLSGSDYATVKYDSNGTQLWAARYDGPAGSDDDAFALAVDDSGNVYVTGSSQNSGVGYDFATIKYDPNGKQVWVSRYDGPAHNNDGGCALAVDGSGHVYVTGFSYDPNTNADYVTIKYDPNGSQVWLARYNGPANADEGPYDVAVDGSGNVYVTGYCDWEWSHMDYTGDYATVKYDPNGKQLWAARYGGSVNHDGSDRTRDIDDKDVHTLRIYPPEDCAVDLATDDSGNVYVTGYSYDSNSRYDYATIKYDSFGSELWVARYQGLFNGLLRDYNRAKALTIDNSGNVYVTGKNNGTFEYYATIKYDPNGIELWEACYNGPGYDTEWPEDLAIDHSGNVYVTGGSYGNSTSCDYATIKYTQHDYCLGPIEGDFNGDCKVDFLDFSILAEAWLVSSYSVDLAILAEDWLECNFALQEDCW